MIYIIFLFLLINTATSIDLGSISLAASSSCVILDGREVRCWGNLKPGIIIGDQVGEMGNNIPVIDLGTESLPQRIINGGAVTCVFFTNRRVKCWGESGLIGKGPNSATFDEPSEMGDNLAFIDLDADVKDMCSGSRHSCVITTDNRVKCWGDNTYGQLGYGDTDWRGNEPGEMGSALPFVEFGAGIPTSIVCGGGHTCILLEIGGASQVKCWGTNAHGQLGTGNTNNYGDGTGAMGFNLPTVNLGTGLFAVQITTSNFPICGGAGCSDHTCALLNNNQVKCWGANYEGQLGYEDTTHRGRDANQMGDNLPAIDFGSGEVPRLVVAGIDITCAVFGNSNLKCWGYGIAGALGKGNTDNIGDRSGTMGSALTSIDLGTTSVISEVEIGARFICVSFEGIWKVKCWGIGFEGRTGLETTEDIGDEAGEMGVNLPFINLGTDRTIFNGATVQPTTAAPTKSPTTAAPTKSPTARPTGFPTRFPTARPITSPTATIPTTPFPTISPTPPTPIDQGQLYENLIIGGSIVVGVLIVVGTISAFFPSATPNFVAIKSRKIEDKMFI